MMSVLEIERCEKVKERCKLQWTMSYQLRPQIAPPPEFLTGTLLTLEIKCRGGYKLMIQIDHVGQGG